MVLRGFMACSWEFENPLQAGKGGLEVDMEEVENPLSHTVPEDDMEV